MKQVYLEYQFTINPMQPAAEILIAELGVVGFESFVETDTGLLAYIQEKDWNEEILEEIFILKNTEFTISYTKEYVEQINWNESWEKNFQPIDVGGLCTVRASFHEKTGTDYDIVITPKMSFGTGHHETTYLMIQHLLKTNFHKKSVLDMGCGTGILAILAEMRGAQTVDAIDIDSWCYTNTLENITANDCQHIRVFEGDASLLTEQEYDVIIANINRNILLNDIPAYTNVLREDGLLFLSGFYLNDMEMIDKVCDANSLKFVEKTEKNGWVAVKYVNSLKS